MTGGNFDVNYSPARYSANLAEGFLFNPAWTGGLSFTVTQPLLKNAGIAINKTFIKVAQNNAVVEQHIFRDRVLTVIASVEQNYWELVFAKENMKVAQAALKAAEELLAANRIKAKAGVMSVVDVLQAEAAVASRVEQVLVAERPFAMKKMNCGLSSIRGKPSCGKLCASRLSMLPSPISRPSVSKKPSRRRSSSVRKSSRQKGISSPAN